MPKKAKAKKGRTPSEQKNGVPVPREGTDTAKVFALADELSKGGRHAVRKDVLAAASKAKINVATAATQYGRWRVFKGLEGRA